MKLVPSWPEANRTRRSKSEPGRNQASTNPMQRRSRRSLQALWSPPVGCPWRFKPCKCMQMEIHRKTYKNYLKTFYTSSESLLAMRPTWMPWIVTRKWLHLPKKCPAKVYQAQTSVEHLELQGRKQQAAPMLHQMNLLKSRSWGHVGHFLTRLTKETRAMELMALRSIRTQLAREMRSAQHLVSDPTNLSDINAHNCQSVFAI